MKKRCFKKRGGFSLVETMMTTSIFLIVAVGTYSALSSGRSTMFETDTSMTLQQNLRYTLEKVTRELQESGFDKNGVWQVALSDAAGVNNSDILRFSIPIICHSGDSVIDSNSDVAYWGAPLTWGCTSSSCMDADDNCNTVDYKTLEYSINSSNQLLRKVLDNNSVAVRQDVVAQNITDFQLTNSADQNVVTLQISAQKKSPTSKTLTAAAGMDVYLRN